MTPTGKKMNIENKLKALIASFNDGMTEIMGDENLEGCAFIMRIHTCEKDEGCCHDVYSSNLKDKELVQFLTDTIADQVDVAGMIESGEISSLQKNRNEKSKFH